MGKAKKHRAISTGDKRVIIVGDVHGCLGKLKALLEDRLAVNFAEDVVILAGDLVVKGPDSIGVVQYAMEKKMLAIKGNHDIKAIKAAKQWRKKRSEPKPAHAFVKEMSEEQLAWLDALPFTITDLDKKAIVVHAGFVPGRSLSRQSETDMTTMRNLVPLDGVASPGQPSVVAVDHAEAGVPWASLWEGGNRGEFHVFFGHDSKRGLQLWPLATGLDTGACKGGSLTAAVMPGHEIVAEPPLPREAFNFPAVAQAHAVALKAHGGQDVPSASARPVAIVWGGSLSHMADEGASSTSRFFATCCASLNGILAALGLRRSYGYDTVA